MSEDNKELNATAEGTENAAESANDTGNVIPLNADKNAAGGKQGGNVGVYVHKFKKPFEYEGKKYDTLNFYFERLTGDDVISVETEMQANNEYALDLLLSRNAQSKLASRASGVADNVIRAMPIREFNSITNAARNFLIDSGY